MKRFLGGIALVALAVCSIPDTGSAQMSFSPVWGLPGGVGVTINGDYGRGLNDESGKENYIGGRVVVGLPMVSIFAGGGMVTLDPDSKISFGGGAAVNVIKAPMLPVAVAVQGGVGYIDAAGVKTLNFPIGPVVSINVPSPAVDVKPWIMPRVHIQRVSNGTSDTEVGFGASAGLNVTLPMGVGGHVALDWMTIGDPSVKPFLVGIGAHYTISVPSLGVM
ncbi:MAG: hypothetical protein GTN62_14075 [Gemmatimonadales bacterium]|nr:hypothetical protein [Gemmatimonadales bacterium]NIN13131.1 hypothetical protein [Gemmatimonadales bacterium]NIN51215.1 hypothetical protein [Gemmatimonadales bacterium]NIP08679.1 hypothetical protein [Gemmatimonadales bacterium]NIR02367.1 hypothetical protein [Gemmatimonadales bacterium]